MFATNIDKYDKIDEVIYPDGGTLFLQFVFDNTDHNMATTYGKNTHHRLGSIAIANKQMQCSLIKIIHTILRYSSTYYDITYPHCSVKIFVNLQKNIAFEVGSYELQSIT